MRAPAKRTINRRHWTQDEDALILKYAKLAPNWKDIAKQVEKKLDRTAKQIGVGTVRESEA